VISIPTGRRCAGAVALAACLGVGAATPADQAIPPLVVLVTIDGLRGDYIGQADAYRLKLPHLRRLMREGARSERTLSVFPTLTGTAHTSLVTGTWAGKHRILGNNRFDPSAWSWDADNYDRQPPYASHAEVAVETLWSAARRRGVKTAAVGWPQVADGPTDYRISIAVGRTAAESRTRTHASASPGWIEAVEETLGAIAALDLRMADHVKALVAVEILKRFQPAFMAVHFTLTDSVQHAQGPGTLLALAAMEDADHNVGVLLDGLAAANLLDRATVIVTGDHGFLPMHTELAINLPLVEAGLIRRGAAGQVEWDAIVSPNRGLGSLYVRKEGPAGAAARARAALEGYARLHTGRFVILEREALDRFGADSGAVLGVEPAPGYVLDGRLTPPFAQPHGRAAGHGYRPDTPGMETGLVLWGSRIRAGVVLPQTRTIDVAPTIALLLGLELPAADGQALAGVLR
jgi:predicted AlkP superfamily pyrophosphatase or phosphodiesterase